MKRIALAALLLCALAAPSPGQPMQVGLNLNGIAYWDPAPFSDQRLSFAPAGLYQSGWAPLPASTPYDANDYPTSGSWSTIGGLTGQQAGDYTLTWRGTADSVTVTRGGGVQPVRSLSTAGGVTSEVVHLDGPATNLIFSIDVRNTSPANPLTDLHLYAPGSGPASPFLQPEYSAYAKSVTSGPRPVVRLMDWGSTNNWRDPNDATYSQLVPITRPSADSLAQGGTKGVSLATMGRTVQALGASAWFCTAVGTGDAQIHQEAAYWAHNMPAGSKLYAEYGNEAWNGGAAPYHQVYALAQADASLPGADPYTRLAQEYAKQSAHVASIYRQEFAAAGRPASDVVGVLGTQAWSPWTVTPGMDYLRATGQDGQVQAIASAPYMANDDLSQWHNGMSAADVVRVQKAMLDSGRYAQILKLTGDLAKQYGKRYVAYETGAGLSAYQGGMDASMAAVFAQAEEDPAYRDIERRMLEQQQLAGLDLSLQFTDQGTWTAWGDWGLRQGPGSVTQKMLGLQDFIAESAPSPSVPEPTALALLPLAGVLLARRRRA